MAIADDTTEDDAAAEAAFRKGLDKAARAAFDELSPEARRRKRMTAAWVATLPPEQKREHDKLPEAERALWFDLAQRGESLDDEPARPRWRQDVAGDGRRPGAAV